MLPVQDSRWVSVDHAVLAPDELHSRIAAELDGVRHVSMSPDHGAAATPSGHSASGNERARRLHHLWHTVVQPPLEQAPGVRGGAAFFVKRFVRRTTSWYVEPRWAAQHEIDAEVARFATDCMAAITSLEARVEELELQNHALQRRLRMQARGAEEPA
jgi:hypothetical protein